MRQGFGQWSKLSATGIWSKRSATGISPNLATADISENPNVSGRGDSVGSTLW